MFTSVPVQSAALAAGVESRYYVRAAMDPTFTTVESMDLLVKAVLRGAGETRHLPVEDRARVAAAALAGWVTHRA